MHELAPIIKDLAIILGMASIVVLLFQKIRQPLVLGYIIAGIIVSPYTPPYSLIKDLDQIQTLAELGVIFLMFSIGLDFSFHKLKKIGGPAIATGLLKILLLTLCGIWIGGFFDWPPSACILFGIAIAISSTTIIIKTLEEFNLQGKRFTDVVLGVLIVEDLVAVLLLTYFATIGTTKNILSLDMLFAVTKLVLVIGSWFLAGYFAIPTLFRKIIKYVSAETLTVVSVALCLLLATIAAKLHYSDALGAFIMGSILAETPFAPRIKQLTNPLRDIFAAIFFISIGMLLNIKALADHWLVFLAVALLTIAGKILFTSIAAFLTGQNIKTSIRVGLSMPPIGEFSFIIISSSFLIGNTPDSLYQMVIALAAVSTLVTPYLIRLSSTIAERVETTMPKKIKYLFESYTAWTYRAYATYKSHDEYRSFLTRLILNSIIITAIFNLAYDFLLPQLVILKFNFIFAKIISWGSAVLFSAPFIWGMLFSYKIIKKNPRLPPLLLSWALTILQIIILSISYCKTRLLPLIIASVAALLFWISYKYLDRSYHWLERRLVHLLHKKPEPKTKYEELAPWDSHLVEIKITNDTAIELFNKTLQNTQLPQKFGINIVAIQRGSQTILNPNKQDMLLLHDKLIVLGEDDQIDTFKNLAEKPAAALEDSNILDTLTLKTIVLEPSNILIGKSIGNINIREKINGFIAGLERKGRRILNPPSDTILRPNDLLLLVGEDKTIRQWLKECSCNNKSRH